MTDIGSVSQQGKLPSTLHTKLETVEKGQRVPKCGSKFATRYL